MSESRPKGAFSPGRGSQLTPDERREIQHLALIDGCSQAEIARRTGRDRGTIATLLKAADTQELATQLLTDQREAALQILRAGVTKAANAWVRAADVAAEKGDHRPAKDLLIATDVVEEQGLNDGPRVVIHIGMPGQPVSIHPPVIIEDSPALVGARAMTAHEDEP